MPATRLSARVIERLVQAEACELNPHYRDDLRIARLTVAYAASGEAVLCSPFVLACYMTLGVHPDCVWPKIQERRRALEEFSGWKLPPKKPPVTAVGRSQQKLWFEKTNGARAINSRAGETVLRDQAISVPMAAPSIAAAYPNSDHAGSGKERVFFKREEIQEFFETCPPELVSSPELRTVFGMWIAAGKPFGAEIQFFKAMKHYCKGAVPKYKSESTVRSNIRRAEDSGILEVAYRDPVRGNCHHIWIRPRTEKDCGLYRRVTTHRLSIPLLLKWRHRKADSQAKVEPIRKPAQPTPTNTPPAKAAPEKRPAAEHAHRSTRNIGRDQRLALFNAYIALKRSGKTHGESLAEVVRQFKNRFSPDDVEFALKIVGHKNGRDVTEEQERGAAVDVPKCMKCQSTLVQNRGPGPRLVCPKCTANSS